MYLAQNLKHLRSKAGEKQKDIAELLDVSEITQSNMADLLGFKGKSSLCVVETGKASMSIDNLVKLADYFGVTLNQLVKQDLSEEYS